METSSCAKLGARAGWVSGSQVGSSLPSVELSDDRLSTASSQEERGSPRAGGGGSERQNRLAIGRFY